MAEQGYEMLYGKSQMNVNKKKIWIPLAVLLIITAGTSCRPQAKTAPEKTLIPQRPQQLPLEMELEERIHGIAWKAYCEATNLGILAEEGPVICSQFTLFRDVHGLGEKGDNIYEVRFAIFGGPQTRGLILVNEKTKESLVVFPNMGH